MRALYDDDGTVALGKNGGGKSIGIVQKNKKIIDSVKELLKEFSIKPGKIGKKKDLKNGKTYYRLSITGKHDLERFYKEISFDLPRKREKLNFILGSYQIDSFKRGEAEHLIIKTLRKKDKISIYQLAKEINRNPGHRLRRKLITMEEEDKIKSIRVGSNNLKVYSVM